MVKLYPFLFFSFHPLLLFPFAFPFLLLYFPSVLLSPLFPYPFPFPFPIAARGYGEHCGA